MKISSDIYNFCLDHIVDNGDTDLFPLPFELVFFKESKTEIIANLSDMDISNYHPMSLVESLIPKSKFGFRVAHQPFPTDALIFTALVIKIFDEVENGRDPAENNRAFSYRRSIDDASELFLADRTYGDWLSNISVKKFSDEYGHVVRTDISDFYQRIYRHRLENILESLTGETRTVKKIERFVADWRSNQSFGLPVGGSACRLLAEAALNDTDMALIAEGYDFTRYVDDMVIFIKRDQDPYTALAFLARHLSANEGLSLNNQKTKIQTWEEFVAVDGPVEADDQNTNEHLATEKLFWAAYGQEDSDPEALAALMTKDLAQELDSLLAEQFWDMGAIRIVIHAMRLVKNPDVAVYVRRNLSSLLPFAKDISLLIYEFKSSGVEGFENMSDEIVELILSPRMQLLDCARSWFLDLAVRKAIVFSAHQIRRLDNLTGTLDVRQLHLIRWRTNDQNYFRSRKSQISEINLWSQPTFIFGARCLPRDEYTHWIRGIRSRINFPLSREFTDWCLSSYGRDPF